MQGIPFVQAIAGGIAPSPIAFVAHMHKRGQKGRIPRNRPAAHGSPHSSTLLERWMELGSMVDLLVAAVLLAKHHNHNTVNIGWCQ
jgi:hypothetical protein